MDAAALDSIIAANSAEPEEVAAHEPGELDGFGRCMDCGLSYSANVGVYFCFACSEE